MKKLEVRLHRTPDNVLPVGTLAEHERRLFFEYTPQFLATGLELSPFKLQLRPGLIEHTDLAFGPLPGLFDDSLPDGWGLLLMDKHFRRQGIAPATLSPLDRLAYLGTRTMGALTYHPPTHAEEADAEGVVDLFRLGQNAMDVLAGDAAEVLPLLMRAGGSPGGARPKVLVGVRDQQIISGENDLPAGYAHWIVKFAARHDLRDAGPIEYAYSLMAREAGIDMPPTRLFEAKHGRKVHRHFGVQRFDRAEGNRRIHMHTFGNLMQVNFRIPVSDYADLLKATRILTRNHQDVIRLYRRMVFNVVAHNRDDHAKNFAYLLDVASGEWSLAPAYDLTHSQGPGGEHSTTLCGEGSQPAREHCMKLAEQTDIKKRQANAIIEAVNAAAGKWRAFADEAGCTKRVAAAIATSIKAL
jgi:serine/threonine-protein kinase HipA